jgi:UDP-perosamine 4-acetyltransferase
MSGSLPKLVLVGSGGHAKVVAEIFEEAADFEIIGCTSRDSTTDVLGYPILGDDDLLPELLRDGVRYAFVALGENNLRRKLIRHVTALGFELVNAVSRKAVVSRRARLQAGIAIMPGAVINSESKIGEGAIVNTGATVDHDCLVGSYCHIAPGVNLAGTVCVGDGTFLGIGSRVIPGISIGCWAMVGAGAVVIRNVPDRVTVAGVPAKIIRTAH